MSYYRNYSFGYGQNMNSGYSGWSMSNRAKEAYHSGEMPLSKWTKTAIWNTIYRYVQSKDPDGEHSGRCCIANFFDLFKLSWLKENLLCQSSWHHTSKYCNETNFYSLNKFLIDQIIEGRKSPTELFRSYKEKPTKREQTVIEAAEQEVKVIIERKETAEQRRLQAIEDEIAKDGLYLYFQRRGAFDDLEYRCPHRNFITRLYSGEAWEAAMSEAHNHYHNELTEEQRQVILDGYKGGRGGNWQGRARYEFYEGEATKKVIAPVYGDDYEAAI